MKILEDNARREKPIKVSLKVRCPYCNSLLLVEKGDYRKRYDWGYTSDGKSQKSYHYVVDCPCCEEEFILEGYEDIRTRKKKFQNTIKKEYVYRHF